MSNQICNNRQPTQSEILYMDRIIVDIKLLQTLYKVYQTNELITTAKAPFNDYPQIVHAKDLKGKQVYEITNPANRNTWYRLIVCTYSFTPIKTEIKSLTFGYVTEYFDTNYTQAIFDLTLNGENISAETQKVLDKLTNYPFTTPYFSRDWPQLKAIKYLTATYLANSK